MNHYASGGKAQELKSLAQELRSYGREGDTILAHINPQEAAMLKAAGGSGTINPHTGLPEFLFGGGGFNPIKAITNVVTAPVKAIQSLGNATGISPALTKVFQPIEKAVVQPIGQGLASFDKAVGNTIPGGWGTVGTVAASMIPGAQFAALGIGKTAAMTGLGALTGSGVLRPGRSFNLQGAVMGGAMAYGSSQLADYLASAGQTPSQTYGNLSGAAPTEYVPSEYLRGTSIGPDAGLSTQMPVSSSVLNAPDIQTSLAKPIVDPGIRIPTPGSSTVGIGGYAPTQNILERAGSYAANIPGKVGDFVTNLPSRIGEFADKATSPSTYADFGKSYAQNVSDIGSGIKNLITTPGAGKAAAAATGINPLGAAGATLYGATGLMALNEQEKLLNEQLANQQIAQAEYDQALGEINRQRDYAAKMVRENPFKLEQAYEYRPDRTVYERTDRDKNLYGKSKGTLYAEGGDVKGYFSGGIMGAIAPKLEEIVSKFSSVPSTETAQSPSPISKFIPASIREALAKISPNSPALAATPSGSTSAPTGTGFGLGSLANAAAAVGKAIQPPTPSYDYLGRTLYDKTPMEEVGDSYISVPRVGSGMFGSGGDGSSISIKVAPRGALTLYEELQKSGKTYAYGGSVDDEMGGDYSAMGMNQGNMQRGLFGMGYKEGGNVSRKEREDFLDMINFDARTAPPPRYVEGMGFVTPPPSIQGRLGANIDALGGNVRAGASGMAMLGPDGKIMTMPGMMDVGYRRRVGPGDLDIGLQRAIRAMPGRDKDYAVNANYRIPFAEGGQPRFLSGGGDGMSDSIPANIEGKQEARLADGEFVIPADVVSHLGNGSSKAGAKRLYAMMDRVRQERTGTTKQGKEINPRKFMPA